MIWRKGIIATGGLCFALAAAAGISATAQNAGFLTGNQAPTVTVYKSPT